MPEQKQFSLEDTKELLSVSNHIDRLFLEIKDLCKLLNSICETISESSLFLFGLILVNNNFFGCKKYVSDVIALRDMGMLGKESKLFKKDGLHIASFGLNETKGGKLFIGTYTADVFYQTYKTMDILANKISRIISEREKTKFLTGYVGNRENQQNHKSIFHSLPVAMIEFEFGPIFEFISLIKAGRAEDIKDHISTPPGKVKDLFKYLKFIDINQEALNFFGVNHRKAFPKDIQEAVAAKIYRNFTAIAKVLREGKKTAAVETSLRTINGKIKEVYLKWGVMPGFKENALVVSFIDITAKKKMEKKLKKSLSDLEKNFKGAIDTLSKIVEVKDPYTAGHQKKVTRLSVAIAKEMGLGRDIIKPLSVAAAIHDIGKINIPASILAKPGSLTQLEYNMIKTHPRLGHYILDKIRFPWPIDDIILQHHERIDGSGYPQGLKEDDIMAEAKILAIADVVEAISSHRPYRPSRGIDKALEELEKNKGRLYCSAAAEACIRLIRVKRFSF